MWGCGPAATTQYSQHNIRRHHTLTNKRTPGLRVGTQGVDCQVVNDAGAKAFRNGRKSKVNLTRQHLNVAVDSRVGPSAVSASLKVAASCTTRWINILTKPLFFFITGYDRACPQAVPLRVLVTTSTLMGKQKHYDCDDNNNNMEYN